MRPVRSSGGPARLRRVLQAPTLPAAGPCLNFVEAVLNQPCTRPAPPPLPRLAAALFELDAPPLDPGTANETTAVTAAATVIGAAIAAVTAVATVITVGMAVAHTTAAVAHTTAVVAATTAVAAMAVAVTVNCPEV